MRILPKSEFARHITMLSAGSLASQVILFVITPITTRFYTPADYGVLGIFTAILNVILLASSGRYELAITIPEKDGDAINLFSLSVILNTFTAVIVGLVVWLWGKQVLSLVNGSALAPYAWMLPVSIFGGGIYQSLTYWAVRSKRFSDLTKTKLHQSIGGGVTTLGLGYLQIRPLGLLVGQFVSMSFGLTTLLRPLIKNHKKELKSSSIREMGRLAVRYKKFALLSAPSALLNNAASFLPILLISSFYGTEKTGLFSLAMRIVGIPGILVGAAVMQVYMGETAEIVRNDRSKLAGMFSNVTRKLVRISGLVILFGCVSPYIFGFIFGHNWQNAGLYAAFLSVSAAAQLVVSPISTVAILMERQDLQMIGDLTRSILVAIALVVPHTLGWTAEATVATYALTMALTYAGFYLMYRWIVCNASVGDMGGITS
ncbi:oligosaccharide flippase family protein [bacterium]|nr:oligosaccharide flippase family protein [bacterium]